MAVSRRHPPCVFLSRRSSRTGQAEAQLLLLTALFLGSLLFGRFFLGCFAGGSGRSASGRGSSSNGSGGFAFRLLFFLGLLCLLDHDAEYPNFGQAVRAAVFRPALLPLHRLDAFTAREHVTRPFERILSTKALINRHVLDLPRNLDFFTRFSSRLVIVV